MNLSPKAQTIERDFQNARAKANYTAFPEFARRYVKHNKDGVGKHFTWFSKKLIPGTTSLGFSGTGTTRRLH